MNQLRERAEEEAIRVFARNLHDLLLAAPAGQHTVIGLDPGIRTGVKVAVVDATGKVVGTSTIYPHEPRRDWEGSLATLRQLAQKHGAGLISIGNGTASRETDKLAAELMRRHPELKRPDRRLRSRRPGYSASELAAQEFPISTCPARRGIDRPPPAGPGGTGQIEPKAIGVGQYQHDLNQSRLARSLDAVSRIA